MGKNLKIIQVRKNVYDRSKVVFQGAFYDSPMSNGIITVKVDGEEVKNTAIYREGRDVWTQYRLPGHIVTKEVAIEIEDTFLNTGKTVEIYSTINGETTLGYKDKVSRIRKEIASSMYQVDELQSEGDRCKIRGWAVYDKNIEIYAIDMNGSKLDANVSFSKRRDVEDNFPEIDPLTYTNQIGFVVDVEKPESQKVILMMMADGEAQETLVTLAQDGPYDRKSFSERMHNYMRYYGPKAFALHAVEKLQSDKPKKQQDYTKWAELHEPTLEEIDRQRNATFNKKITFSIAVPLFNTPIKYLTELIESVQAQTYSDWQLCFADGSDNDELKNFFSKNYTDDSRICYKKLRSNDGIAGNTNAALEMATGEYIVLADHDDLLASYALYEFMRVIDANDDADVIYSDEDKIDMKGKKRFDPYFKSDFNPDLLACNNYICHLFAFRRSLLDKVGLFRKEFDGAQDYDFILRCTEEAERVYHVPMVLYHWRCHMGSTSFNPQSKMYAYEAGLRAAQAHFDRIGVNVIMEDGLDLGFYHPHHVLQGSPLVSILIPNKDHIEDLEKCIASIERNTYSNYEVIVIENNSTEDETFKYYEKLKDREKCSVVYYEGDFNFSKINNFGAESAKGEYLLFLNNDIEAITSNFLEEMLGFCQREDVGIVGAQLFYPDQTLQHAGVVIGIGGIAGHTFVGQTPKDANAFGRANSAQDYSAVTAACMLSKRSVFDKVGGFDETLGVAFNDIDYCLKIRELGLLCVYNPKAQMYHYESKSRGYEDTPEKQQRFANEIDYFRSKWGAVLEAGDPYYNPNLTLEKADMSLK